MKKIAVITGASSGMGKRFAETVDQYGAFDSLGFLNYLDQSLDIMSVHRA